VEAWEIVCEQVMIAFDFTSAGFNDKVVPGFFKPPM